MKIVFDLDGVIRDLSGCVASSCGCKYPNVWDFDFRGKTLVERVNDNKKILLDAKPTAYRAVIKSHYTYPEIWTNQPEEWRPLTMKWVNRFLGSGCVVRFMSTEEKSEELKKHEDIVLVEDSPLFKDYDKILLIDRPYNHCVQGALRVFGARHLNNLLEIMKER